MENNGRGEGHDPGGDRSGEPCQYCRGGGAEPFQITGGTGKDEPAFTGSLCWKCARGALLGTLTTRVIIEEVRSRP
jgi:hypothetical protein